MDCSGTRRLFYHSTDGTESLGRDFQIPKSLHFSPMYPKHNFFSIQRELGNVSGWKELFFRNFMELVFWYCLTALHENLITLLLKNISTVFWLVCISRGLFDVQWNFYKTSASVKSSSFHKKCLCPIKERLC